MNKSELIAKVAHDTKLTRGEAEEVVEATIENIIEALKGGDDVRLMGFGVFTVSRRKGARHATPRPERSSRCRPPKGPGSNLGNF